MFKNRLIDALFIVVGASGCSSIPEKIRYSYELDDDGQFTRLTTYYVDEHENEVKHGTSFYWDDELRKNFVYFYHHGILIDRGVAGAAH